MRGTGKQTPDLATLPSRTRTSKYTNIHYHRTIIFDKAPLEGSYFGMPMLIGKMIICKLLQCKELHERLDCKSMEIK